MLEYVAAANAAYSVIKTAISNGRELHDCASAIAQFTQASDDLKNKHNQKKSSIWTKFLGKEDNDLETFMHLEQLRQKEEELKQLMIYLGRPGLHSDWVRYQVEARKSRQKAAQLKQKQKQEFKETLEFVAVWFIGILFVVVVVGFFIWIAHRRGII